MVTTIRIIAIAIEIGLIYALYRIIRKMMKSDD